MGLPPFHPPRGTMATVRIVLFFPAPDRVLAHHLAVALKLQGLDVVLVPSASEGSGVFEPHRVLPAAAAAVVLVTAASAGQEGSRWASAEASALLKRSFEDESFRLIPVLVAGAPCPAYLADRAAVSVPDLTRPALGKAAEQIFDALNARAAGAADPLLRTLKGDGRLESTRQWAQTLRERSRDENEGGGGGRP